MLNCFVETQKNAIPIALVLQAEFSEWLSQQNETTQRWLETTQYRPQNGNFALIPDVSGKLSRIIFCLSDSNNFWSIGSLPFVLPEGVYYLEQELADTDAYAIAWGLGCYQFLRYKSSNKKPSQLILPANANKNYIHNIVESIYLVRDLINTPTDDMGPAQLAAAAEQLANKYQGHFKQIIGNDLLSMNFPAIHLVGRASCEAPRLLDLRWGNAKHPKVTLVGKGVCFDSGGLNIKPSSGLSLMKKDMGGAAHVLGLANMIMQANLPIQLRVLIPAVENAIAGNAYRPGDVVTSRKGISIEIGNTDAEGRVVLADALTEAVSEAPDLVIDIATLTGAARIALGTDLPAMFCNQDELAQLILEHADKQNDPVWRLPLFAMYRDAINSSVADINNNTPDSYAGAITAALFLKEFVPDNIAWLHFDLMAWNIKSRPGRPQGGEAMSLRTLFSYLQARYAS
jgi:leucyl aminopeptidase